MTPVVNPDDADDIPQAGRDLIGGGYQSAVDAGQYKNAIQGYLASSTYADAQMGRVLEALDKSPYRDNTIVVLMSDHGFHLGEKTHWCKGTLWEEATHNLLMFRVPGVTKPGQICKRTVSLLDVYPTLVELAGLPKPDHLDGHSLVPQLKNPEAPRKQPAISAYQKHISVRTERYRYIRYGDGSEELYDRSEDPREWKNLASDPKYADTKKKLADLLPKPEEMAPMRPGKKRKKKERGHAQIPGQTKQKASATEKLLQARRLAIAGLIDVNDDGKCDLEVMRRLIKLNGGQIDAELGVDGKLTGELHPDTGYIILGEIPDKTTVSPRVSKQFDAFLRRANELGIPVVPLKELFRKSSVKGSVRPSAKPDAKSPFLRPHGPSQDPY